MVSLTFTSLINSIKVIGYGATAISMASPCIVPDQRKPSETAVGSHHIKGIVAAFISHGAVCDKAIGRSSRRRTGYGCNERQ